MHHLARSAAARQLKPGLERFNWQTRAAVQPTRIDEDFFALMRMPSTVRSCETFAEALISPGLVSRSWGGIEFQPIDLRASPNAAVAALL